MLVSTRGLRTLSAGVLAVLVTLAVPLSARAQLGQAPARTWGIGPAAATSASVGKPRVLAILPVGDRVYVAGTFDSVIDPSGVSYPVKNVAVFSATSGAADLSFQAATNNTVTSLASDGSRLFLGGTFGTVNGATRKALAAVDLATGSLNAWSPAVSAGQVDALAFVGGDVYAGGNFPSVVGSGGSSQGFLAKISASTGAVDTAWTPAPNDRVRALNEAPGGGRLYVGGDFTSVSGIGGTNKLAAVAPASPGAVDTTFKAAATNQGAYSLVYDITSDATRVYVAAGGGGGACAAMSAANGTLVWSDHSNGDMQSVRLQGGLLYCAGHFGGTGSFAGQTRQKIAAVDPASGVLTAFAPNVNSSQGPWSLAADAGHLYMGGDFSRVAGVDQPHYAVFTDSALVSVPYPPMDLKAQPDTGVVHLSWSAPSTDGGSPLQKYKVYRSTISGGQNLTKTPLATLSNSVRNFDDTSVTNGSTYYYVVVATNAVGASTPSTKAFATPSGSSTATAPGAPISVTATTPPGYIHLQWNPPSSDGGSAITSYRIYRGTTPGGEATSPVGTASTTSFDDLYNLTAGTPYYYTVTAANSAGESVPSTEVSATAVAGVPGPPQLSAAPAAGPAVQLTWTVPPDGGSPITRYIVLRDGVRLVTLPATGNGPTGYTDTVVAGTTYVYQVRAANLNGNGQLSNKATITP